MATLAKDVNRDFGTAYAAEMNDIPVIASDIIYQGAAVGESSSTGTARPLVAGDTFLGFAEMQADNSSGSAADIKVRVRQRGSITISVTSASGIADLGAKVFASDDATLTLASTGNSLIGKVLEYNSGTTVVVGFQSKLLDLEV